MGCWVVLVRVVLIGVLLIEGMDILGGITFLILYFVKKIPVFLIIAIILFAAALVVPLIFLGLKALSNPPAKVKIEGVTYRTGFYGDLWILKSTTQEPGYSVGFKQFYRVNHEQFDWIHSDIGGKSGGILYCAENQWEQAYTYYADPTHYDYFCKIMSGTDEKKVLTMNQMDPTLFNELMLFAEKNCDSSKGRQLPDNQESLRFTVYRTSKDGFFTSFEGYEFHILEGALVLRCYQGFAEVPPDLGQYFIKLLYDNQVLGG